MAIEKNKLFLLFEADELEDDTAASTASDQTVTADEDTEEDPNAEADADPTAEDPNADPNATEDPSADPSLEDPSADPNAEADPSGLGGEEGMDGEMTNQPEVDPEEEKLNNNKRLVYFRNFKSLYKLIEDFIDKLESLDKDEIEDDKNKNLIVFSKEKSNKLLENINLILKDKIETIDLKVLETVFINMKTEMNLLIDIFEKVVKATETKTKKETK